MNKLKAFFRRLFCFHTDPREWSFSHIHFEIPDWETREVWKCSCGYTRALHHRNVSVEEHLRLIRAHQPLSK